MILVTSPDIATALEKGIQYQGLTHLSGKLSLQYSTRHIALCYQPNDLHSNLGVLRAQCEISGTFKFIQDLYKMMGMSAPRIRIELPFTQPQQSEVL